MLEQQKRVLDYLRIYKDRWISPTEIGHELWPPAGHSAWASPKCKILVRDGFAKRNKKGWYKFKGGK